jgi:micrococcal nuclease
MKKTALLLSAFMWLNTAAAQTTFSGNVVRILDGDTVEILDQQKTTIRVRLANIDAPEKKQAFGEVARQALAKMAYRQDVQVTDRGGDRYGRRIGVLTVNGKELNSAMVAQGMAWVYARYNTDPSLPGIEQKARAEKVGLWADTNPTPPWEFRHAR